MGIFFKESGKLFFRKVGIFNLTWEITFLDIFNCFLFDLSIIHAKPATYAFDFFINLTHSKLDFPVVMTSSIIKTFALGLILKPLRKQNFPLTLSQNIVSFFKSLPTS